MNPNFHEATGTSLAPVTFPRPTVWLKQAWKKLDPISLQLASKTSLAIVISIGIAFYLDLNATMTGVTALMIQQGYVGATIKRGLLRLAGGVAGAVIGVVLIALFGQDRWLFIAASAICVGVMGYLLQASNHWYAYIIAVASLLLVGYANTTHPLFTFQFSVYWVSGILLAIVTVSLVHGLLWPSPTAKVFKHQLHQHLIHCQSLIQWLKTSEDEAERRSGELQATQQQVIKGLSQLRTTLQTATYDSWRIEKYHASYHGLIEQTAKLSRDTIRVFESLKICREKGTLGEIVEQSDSFKQIIEHLDKSIQAMADTLAQPLDGTSVTGKIQVPEHVKQLCSQLADEIKSTQTGLLERGVSVVLPAQLLQLASAISDVHHLLAHVETKAALQSARATAIAPAKESPPFKPRLLKSLTATLVMLAVPCIWIFTNWPMALNRLMLYAGVLACLNCLLPLIPRRAILTAIAAGAVTAAFLYFGVLRAIDGFPALGLVIFLATLPYCYMINSPRPGQMLMGLFGGMVLLGLIDLSLVQTYSFSSYVNNLIGYGGGFIIAMIILQMLRIANAEQSFVTMVRKYFASCGQTMAAFDANPPYTEQGKVILRRRIQHLFTAWLMSGLWLKVANARRIPTSDLAAVRQLMTRMQSLSFRLYLAEESRIPLPDQETYRPLRIAEKDLRNSLKETFDAVQQRIQAPATSDTRPDVNAKISELRGRIGDINDQKNPIDISPDQLNLMLAVAGYYQALSDDLERCHKHVTATDWRLWQQSHL